MVTCPICSVEMPYPKVMGCGAPECTKAYHRKRMREWQRERRARDGAWYSTRFRSRKSNTSCVDCGEPVAHGRTQETRCRKCGKAAWNARQAAESRRVAGRRRAEKKLARAAEGVSRGWVFVSGPCHSCGTEFTCQQMNSAAKFCSRTCLKRETRAVRRALEAGVTVTPGRRHAVFVRDNWTCRICGDPVNRDARVPELDAPTIDHIVPLARGGAHAPENWQTAHYYCNSHKRDQIGFEFADKEGA